MHKCHIIHVSRGEGLSKASVLHAQMYRIQEVFYMQRYTEYRREGKAMLGQHYKCIKMVNITCGKKLFSSIPANFSEVCRLFLMFSFDNCMRIFESSRKFKHFICTF
jgi:rRNA maturation protein Nop10